MPLLLSPITPSDTLSWTRIRSKAYLGPTHELIHRGPISEDSILKSAEDRKREIGRQNTWHWKIVDTDLAPSDGDPDDNGGKTIAIAVWSAHNVDLNLDQPLEEQKKVGKGGVVEGSNEPASAPAEGAELLSSFKKDEEPPFLPPEVRIDVLNALFAPIRAAQKEIMGEKPYFILNTLATLQEHARRGAASMLLKWGLDMADELGLETYLDTTPVARRLYERSGFVLVKDIYFDRTPWGGEGTDWYGAMVRKPKASE
ncbi:hypothetical protein BDV96DRAFT_274845 [Lophiotrema nucula]|uniref:N-acetyltransferase domain-containing protein n=1 Tax=Lophiotrema nucula TaxID=690887 RepID=A0A6A5ZP15_9PLEO|nr:hypothetical protein BDV96DRAFT_274845 [Lophiotrema nucula]